MTRLAAWLAIAVAIPLAAAQLYRNFDNWNRWPSWVIDEVAAAGLLVAGALALRQGQPRYLAPAWAFAFALYLSSVATRIHALPMMPPEIYGAELMLTRIVSALAAVSFVGLALSLADRKKPA